MSNTRFVPLRTIALCACLLPSLLLAGCGGGSSSTSTTAPVNTGPVTSAPRTFGSLQFTLSADKAVYAAHDKPAFTLTVRNIGTQTVTVSFPTLTTQQFDITRNGQFISSSSQGAVASLASVAFAPGQTAVFSGSWDHLVETTGQYAPAGQYTVTAWLPARGLDGTALSAADAQANLSANPITIQTQ